MGKQNLTTMLSSGLAASFLSTSLVAVSFSLDSRVLKKLILSILATLPQWRDQFLKLPTTPFLIISLMLDLSAEGHIERFLTTNSVYIIGKRLFSLGIYT